MSRSSEDKLRAWVQDRVREHGTIDKAWPRDEFTIHAWRELCRHLNIGTGKAGTLQEALEKVAELAG